jgi:thiol-disulfide isomerase/thioredoxin
MPNGSTMKASLKYLFDQGMPFAKFLQTADAAMKKQIQTYLGNTDFSELNLAVARISFDKPSRLLFFGDFWCPDCVISTAAVIGLQKAFPDLEVKVLSRDGNEEIIKVLGDGDKAKIPTLVPLSIDFEPLGIFIERPAAIRALEQTEDQIKRIVMMRDYRAGKFIAEAALELMGMWAK